MTTKDSSSSLSVNNKILTPTHLNPAYTSYIESNVEKEYLPTTIISIPSQHVKNTHLPTYENQRRADVREETDV